MAQVTSQSVGERIGRRVERVIGETRFDRYFRPSVRFTWKDGLLDVAAPSAFEAELLSKRFEAEVREAAKAELGCSTVEVRFRACPAAEARNSETAASGAAGPGGKMDREASRDERAADDRERTRDRSPWPRPERGVDPASRRRKAAGAARLRHRLDDFIVGPSNQLAYHAASRIASADCPPGFSPLFLHGDCGVGKTHLLQGIAASMMAAHPAARVRYTTGEAFTNDYITAIRERRVDSFRARYRELDLLCIDDVHFLSNKKATQQEFLFTFDAVGQCGARVALASDEHPSRIAEFTRELRSRFLSGMVVELRSPDQQTRIEITRRLAERRGLPMDDGGVAALAARCAESVREIEGALTRLEILRQLSGERGAIRALEVSRALGSVAAARPAKPIRFEQIVETVCEALRTPVSDLLGRGRHTRVVLARGMAAHLARELTTMSYPEVARAMNRPNHSSAITAHQRVRRKIESGAACEIGPEFEGMSVADLAARLTREVIRKAGE